MKLIEFETAYEMVSQHLNIDSEDHKLSKKDYYMSLIIAWHGVSEVFYGWIFPYYTRGEAETNNFNYIKLGGGPVLITRWGELHHLGTFSGIPTLLKRYKSQHRSTLLKFRIFLMFNKTTPMEETKTYKKEMHRYMKYIENLPIETQLKVRAQMESKNII